MQEWLDKAPFAAIGEIGLDYYWDQTFVAAQKEAFRRQIDWALERALPIVIHSRNATQDCIDIVREKQNGQLKGIFHCFGDDLNAAQQIIDLGFKLGIGGVVTFKNSTLPEVLRAIDLEHLVLETDAPYLAPVPYRGKRNESSYIPLIAQKIADIKEVPLSTVAACTTKTAEALFS
ncbi:putative metal-dependent hydrolase YcfH [compost metagenome]